MRRAAFFDVDGTLIRRPSTLVLAPALRRAGVVSRRQLARAAWWELGARVRGSTEADLHAVTERGARALAGFSAERMAAIVADELDRRLVPLTFSGAVDLVQSHDIGGELTIAVTGALEAVAVPLAERLGIGQTIATELVVGPDGCYTGDVMRSCHGAVKVSAVRELAEREHIDLDASAAYTDSASDLALLELVGRPFAVNPDRALARIAAERDWPVLRLW
jgi:HAD superfamily hydrolase (TIGR01490 family)